MIVALTGGIGGTKLALGLCQLLEPDRLTIVANTGDDLQWLGLRICPDLDTVLYTLSGEVNPSAGWGLKGDTFYSLSALQRLGGPAWFQVGDRDLATHLWRSALLQQGLPLSEATRRICRSYGVEYPLLPMSDDYTPTYLETDRGRLHIQEYLVRESCRPHLHRVEYQDIGAARPSTSLLESIQAAEAVVLCPSNPLISLGPILAVPGVREALRETGATVIAVTPVVQRRALKGPLAKMLQELGYEVSPVSVARFYRDFADLFVLDRLDQSLRDDIEKLGISVLVCDTVMNDLSDKVRLAARLLEEL